MGMLSRSLAFVFATLSSLSNLDAGTTLSNRSGENLTVCLVEADHETVRWTWKECPRKKTVSFDSGALWSNQTYWMVVVRPSGKSPDGINAKGGFVRYWARTASLPYGNRKVNVGKAAVSKMIKSDDWSGFKDVIGSYTAEYNAIMYKRDPAEGGGGVVIGDGFIYNDGYEEAYGTISQPDANYEWRDIFKTKVKYLGDRAFGEGVPVSFEGLKGEPVLFPNLDEIEVIEK